MLMPNIAIFTEHATLKSQAEALAQRLQLPMTENPTGYTHLLVLTPEYLGLQASDTQTTTWVDFLSGKNTYRRQHASLRRETLARAMGLKNKTTPKIVDMTAGLGRDSFIIASLGFEITLLERSPIIHALLEDGMQRAAQNPAVAPIIRRMHLIHTDAILWIQQQNTALRPNIIYLDPMFPERSKSALVKKEMQIFQAVIGEDIDRDALLTAALACATQRVVVKRPRLADALAGVAPAFSLTGSSSRFDVYIQ
jgi:16S rRNA (guanine1516-N2)-methyltransferase